MRVVFATHNPHKLAEVQAVIPKGDITLCSLEAWDSKAPDETATTFIENALIKARFAAKLTGLPALADDSGILVDALGGAPGLYSAMYAGQGASDQDNRQALIHSLQAQGVSSSRAQFYCVMVLVQSPHDPKPMIGEGLWSGEVKTTEKGLHGFGYDPMFYVPSHNCMAAELPPEIKLYESHRYQALMNVLEAWRTQSKHL